MTRQSAARKVLDGLAPDELEHLLSALGRGALEVQAMRFGHSHASLTVTPATEPQAQGSAHRAA